MRRDRTRGGRHKLSAVTSLVAVLVPWSDLPPDRLTPGPTVASSISAQRTVVTHDPTLAPERRSQGTQPFDAGLAAIPVSVDGQRLRYRLTALATLPGSSVELVAPRAGTLTLTYSSGSATAVGSGRWSWRAPDEPGTYALRIAGSGGEDAVSLTVMVLHPLTAVENGSLYGYSIGSYAAPGRRGSRYEAPRGFVEVAPADEDILVSPHFTLGQFLCKQRGVPRYMAYSLELVTKLETVLAAVVERGIDVPTLAVMSGFRTPAYNLAIGNTTIYSRHLWGDAADIYVDADGDGEMDDLNRDGRVDRHDAAVLSSVVEQIEETPRSGVAKGGLGVYRRNSAHGPFVHVDARGYSARW